MYSWLATGARQQNTPPKEAQLADWWTLKFIKCGQNHKDSNRLEIGGQTDTIGSQIYTVKWQCACVTELLYFSLLNYKLFLMI